MLHLSADRLAALAEDTPTSAEARHLYNCSECAALLGRQLQLLVSARALRDSGTAPLTSWEKLGPALAAEGLMLPSSRRSRPSLSIMRPLVGAAAALLLLLGGMAAGRASAGASILPAATAATAALPSEVIGDSVAPFSNTAEALSVYLRSQSEFQRAGAYLAAHSDEPSTQASAIARLDALEQMHAASAAALREAPTDPVINNFYVSTLNARDATVRHLNQLTPVGARVSGY